MRWLILSIAVVASFTVTSIHRVLAEVSVTTIDYHGWKDSCKVSNGKTAVVVVPQIGGRIMEFSLDGDNPIWVSPKELGKVYEPVAGTWYNYGGYKTWPAPQTLWGWPPDPYLDYGTVKIEKTGPRSIRITGMNSPGAGIQFIKDLTLDESSSRLKIVQKMVNTSNREVEWGVWDVTQMDAPCRIAFAVNPASKFDEGVLKLHTEPDSNGFKMWRVRDGICIVEPGKFIEKIGADTDKGWMLWVNNDLAYLKLFPVQKVNANYQDQGCQAEFFNAPGPPTYVEPYIEMEVSSPIVKLKPGESTELIEIWMLIRLDKPVKTDDDMLKLVDDLKSRKVIK